jgi:hypothetical protein
MILLRFGRSTLEYCRGCDRKGTLIRHEGLSLPSFAVVALPVAMIEPSFRALLVPPVGTSPLMPACELAALRAAITVSAITVRADEEGRVTPFTQTDSLPENRLAVNRRHAFSQAGLDSRRFVAG